MLAKSDFDVATALELLARHGIEAALIVPTPTALGKCYLDATSGVRDYLFSAGYHHFLAQGQGEGHKVLRDVFFVTPGSLERSNLSMYRPETKDGDPRIWFGKFTKANATAFNLLALTVQGGELHVINMSDAAVRASLEDPRSPFRRLVDLHRAARPAATELLAMLREVSSRGYVATLRPGDTGVGMTLETLLGIPANSRRAPDFKGIEIKAKRHRPRGANRSTLFSKAPAWKLSPVGSALGLLRRRGYHDDEGRLQLYQTVSGNYANTKGLRLEVDGERDLLMQVCEQAAGRNREHDVTWELDKLRNDLAAKHRETFWVQARCRGAGTEEQFHYVEVRHTRAPLVRNFASLVEAGIITVDYLLHLEGNRARDHGYLFKIHPRNMGALFPPPEIHVFD